MLSIREPENLRQIALVEWHLRSRIPCKVCKVNASSSSVITQSVTAAALAHSITGVAVQGISRNIHAVTRTASASHRTNRSAASAVTLVSQSISATAISK